MPKHLLHQAASPSASNSKRASSRATFVPLSPMPGSRPTTYHTVQLWAVWIVVLEIFHCLLDFVHTIQVFLQPPCGAENKTKDKKQCPKKQRKKISRKHQTKLRIKITRKISIPFSSTRRRSWDSLLPPLNATAEYPIHVASAVLMIEQQTTLSLAFLSQSDLHRKVKEAAHPMPEKGHHNTLLEAERRLQNSSDSPWTHQQHQQGRKNLWEKGGGKKEKPPMLMRFLWQHVCKT